MTSLTFGTCDNQDAKTSGYVARAIARIISGWKHTRRYDKGSLRNRTFIEQNLIDPNVGPEISRALR